MQRSYSLRRAFVAILFLCIGACDQAAALTSEEKIANAMRLIGEAWQRAIDQRYPLIVNCTPFGTVSETYAARFLDARTTFEFDVERTGKLINPYRGILRMKPIIKKNTNGSGANGYRAPGGGLACFKTVKEALASTTEGDLREEPLDGHIILAEYKITDDKIILDRANDIFSWAFYPWVLDQHNMTLWSGVVRQPIQ